MGSQSNKCRVATLNYSGIYLSPFQYYGLDNWQQLQRIGRIYQFQLKRHFNEIRDNNIRLGDKTFEKVSQYKRNTFEWLVGKIDKVIHEDRYTPIYTSKENIISQQFAGIATTKENNRINHQYIMNQEQFFDKWHNVFSQLPKKQFNKDKEEIKREAKEAKKLHQYNCCMFDFLCFKSIILYLYNKLMDDGKRMTYQQNNTYDFQNIAIKSRDWPDFQIVTLYKKFMTDYFQMIDTQKKITLTIETIFTNKAAPSIVTFTEATPDFRKKLESIENYLLFGPKEESKTKQTLILLNKYLPFIPEGYKIAEFYNNLDDFKRKISKALSQQFLMHYENFWVEQLNKTKKQKQSKEYTAFITFKSELNKDFMFWAKDCLVVDFHQEKIIIGAFHLNSKAEVNCLEVQLLGLFIYYLVVVQKYRIIFSGDFNSYISTSEKDNIMGLFAFIKYLHKYLQVSERYIDEVINSIRTYPKHPKIITTKKKRTILQVQIRKVNDLAQKSIDQVITNYPLDYNLSHVCELKDVGSNKMSNQSFLPHKEHPYDHFLVQALLDTQGQRP